MSLVMLCREYGTADEIVPSIAVFVANSHCAWCYNRSQIAAFKIRQTDIQRGFLILNAIKSTFLYRISYTVIA